MDRLPVLFDQSPFLRKQYHTYELLFSFEAALVFIGIADIVVCHIVEFGIWHHGHHNFLQTPRKIWKTHEAKLGGSFGFYWHCRHCCLPPLLHQAKPNNPDILRLNFLSQVFTSYLSLSTQADKKPCLIQ